MKAWALSLCKCWVLPEQLPIQGDFQGSFFAMLPGIEYRMSFNDRMKSTTRTQANTIAKWGRKEVEIYFIYHSL
jgi:hypothetical protein